MHPPVLVKHLNRGFSRTFAPNRLAKFLAQFWENFRRKSLLFTCGERPRNNDVDGSSLKKRHVSLNGPVKKLDLQYPGLLISSSSTSNVRRPSPWSLSYHFHFRSALPPVANPLGAPVVPRTSDLDWEALRTHSPPPPPRRVPSRTKGATTPAAPSIVGPDPVLTTRK